MALLRIACILFACCACAAGFTPAAMLRPDVQQRSSVISMKTASTKPQRVNERNRLYNKNYKSEMRTRIKNVSASPCQAARAHQSRVSPPQFARVLNASDLDLPAHRWRQRSRAATTLSRSPS